MRWGIAIFGGVLVWAGFADGNRFDMNDKWAVATGGVFIIVGAIAEYWGHHD